MINWYYAKEFRKNKLLKFIMEDDASLKTCWGKMQGPALKLCFFIFEILRMQKCSFLFT